MSAFLKLEDLVEKLLIDTGENVEPEFDAGQCCIYRVPKEFRSIDEKVYTPQLVSIGPLHYRKEELVNMEKTKRQYMKSFLERITMETRDKILNFIKDNEKNIRNYYAETSKLESIEYVMMILYDAIFIIELLLRYLSNSGGSDLLLSTSKTKSSLRKDFQLLENQLPYFVLGEICELADMPTFMELSCYFFYSFSTFELSRLTPEVAVKHLTDWRRATIVGRFQVFAQDRGWIYDEQIKGTCAVKLHKLGVKFKCLEGEDCLIDIRLELGKYGILCFEVCEMQIPNLKIYDDTESLLGNIMALEQCHYPRDTHVCNYVRLMNCLIDTEKDVDLLVRNRIISNSLGDNALVVNMFNKLSQSVSFSKSLYCDICKELEQHCNNPWNWNRTKEILKRVYFNNLLRATATVGTVLLLLLTIIQAICSILQVMYM